MSSPKGGTSHGPLFVTWFPIPRNKQKVASFEDSRSWGNPLARIHAVREHRDQRDEKIVRLGYALYWSARALAVGWLCFVFLATYAEPQSDWSLTLAAGLYGAAVLRIVGCALKYVLAGHKKDVGF
jgi:hypothetical protein